MKDANHLHISFVIFSKYGTKISQKNQSIVDLIIIRAPLAITLKLSPNMIKLETNQVPSSEIGEQLSYIHQIQEDYLQTLEALITESLIIFLSQAHQIWFHF